MSKKRQIIISVLALLSLTLVTTGVSYSLLDHDLSGVSYKSRLVYNYLNYQDTSKFSISNVIPMSDEDGKKLIGDENVFEFSVSGSFSDEESEPYQVVVTKSDDSTLSFEQVKLYVTEVVDGKEYPVLDTSSQIGDVFKGSQLKESSILPIGSSRVVHNDVAYNMYNNKFKRVFRLRMWVSEDAKEVQGKSFSVNVSIVTEN